MSIIQKVIIIFGILMIGGMFLYSILEQSDRNIERFQKSKNFQLSDFSEKEYEITEIWTRSFEIKNAPSLNNTYVYFKVKNEIFNFNFGYQFSDYGLKGNKVEQLLEYLEVGKKVRVLANKDDILYASENSLKRKIFDFFNGTNKEVEVYKLTIENNIIINQDIHSINSSNRGFADIAVGKNLLKLLLFSSIFISVVYFLPSLIKKKNK